MFKTFTSIIILFPFLAFSADKEPDGMPQLDFETYPSLIFWLLVTFVITYLILKTFITPKISDTLQTRKNKIESDLQAAKRFRDEAEVNRIEQEKALKESRLEAQKKYKEIIDKIKSEIANNEISLNAKLKPIIDNGERKISILKKDVLNKISKTSSEITYEVLKKFTYGEISKDEISKVVNLNAKNLS